MSGIKKSNFQQSQLYEEILEKVIRGDVDEEIMNMALARCFGDEDKAQALYILFIVNGYWPEGKINK